MLFGICVTLVVRVWLDSPKTGRFESDFWLISDTHSGPSASSKQLGLIQL